MKTKKSQVEALWPLIIALISIAIVLVVVFVIYSQLKTTTVDMIDSASASETFTYDTNTSFIQLDHSRSAIELSCTGVTTNGTGAVDVGSGNYTCTAGSGILLVNNTGNNTAGAWNSTMNINYSYKEADFAYNATSDVQNATQDIPGWIPIIVIVIIGAILLGLVSLYRRI